MYMTETVLAMGCDPRDKFALGIVIERDARDDAFDHVAAFKAAVTDYAKTEAGMANEQIKSGAFNYGDLVTDVPEDICEANGFRIIDTFQTELIFDHDDSLVER